MSIDVGEISSKFRLGTEQKRLESDMVEGKHLEEARAGLVQQIAGRAERLEETENQSIKPDADVAASPVIDGPRDRVEIDFPYPQWGLQRAALKEYRRTIEEFRQTGTVADKTWHDYAHLTNPDGLSGVVWLAHCEAWEEIERWREEQGVVPPEAVPSQSLTADEDRSHETEVDESVGDEDEGDERDKANNEIEAAQEAADQAKLRALLEGELRARAARAASDAEMSASVPAPMEAPRAPVILRGVEFDPYAPGHWNRREPRLPQLDIAPLPRELPATKDQTETLLNDIIGECHFLMREVAFRSVCQEQAAEDRVNWVNAALRMAETGAKVARSVARLRHGPTIRQSKHDITVTNKVAVVAQGGGGPVP